MIGSLLRGLRLLGKRIAYEGFRRDRRQAPDAVVAALALAPGARVVDLGTGTGYFVQRLARAVGPDGVVYAVDTDTELLEDLVRRAVRAGLPNVVPIVAESDEPRLPERVDVVFASHVFHHLPTPSTYFGRLAASLRSGGRVAILEGRPTGRLSRWFGHVTEPAEVRAAMEAAGYGLVADVPVRGDESFQVFERGEGTGGGS